MSYHAGDFVRVWIDGTERTDYLIEYSRVSSLCELGDTFVLLMSPEIPVAVDPYEEIRIQENYDGDSDYVIRGYAVEISQDFDPGSIMVNGQDKSIRLFDYFIHQKLESSGESVDYWINYIAGLAGLDVQFNATSPALTEAGTLFGMQTAADAILQLERIAAYYTKYDSDIDKLVTFRLSTSESQITIDKPKITRAARELGTLKTRNVVKVYGGYRFNPFTQETSQIFGEARTEIPELLVDKVVVVANPVLTRQTYAYIVADRILSQVNTIDDIQEYNLVGLHPDIRVGDYAYINVNQANYDYEGDRKITTIQASASEQGAQTVMIIGEKCNRISINLPIAPVYVTDTKTGVGISWDAGDTFIPSNTGLITASDKNAWSIAVNGFSRQVVLTSGGIFRRYSPNDTWVEIDPLPAPTNEANDPLPSGGYEVFPMKVVEEPSKYLTFHILANAPAAPAASGDYRYWVYTTQDFGTSWNSKQLYIPAASGFTMNSGAPIGRQYDITAYDIESNLNNRVFVLVSGRPQEAEELIPTSIYFLYQNGNNAFRVYDYDGVGNVFGDPNLEYSYDTGKFIKFAQMFTIPNNNNKDICYVAVITNDGNLWPTYYGSHCYLFRTNDGGSTWAKVHDQQLLDTSTDKPLGSAQGVAFDTSSDEDEVRVVFWQFNFDDWDAAIGIYTHFVTSDPNGSTTYNAVNDTVTLDVPSVAGSEYFSGYFRNSTTSYNFPSKHTRGPGYAFGSVGLAGRIREPGPVVVDTAHNDLIVKFDFGSESIAELCQEVYRTGSTTGTNSLSLAASENSGTVWSMDGDKYTSAGLVDSLSNAGNWIYNIDAENETYFGYAGSFPNFSLQRLNDTTESLGDFYPRPNQNFFAVTYPPYEHTPSDADTYYGCSNASLGSDPNGFVYTADGYTFTQFWDDSSANPRPSNEMIEFEFRSFGSS